MEDYDGRRYLVSDRNLMGPEADYISGRTNDILRERINLGLTGAGKKRRAKKTINRRNPCSKGSKRDFRCRDEDGNIMPTRAEIRKIEDELSYMTCNRKKGSSKLPSLREVKIAKPLDDGSYGLWQEFYANGKRIDRCDYEELEDKIRSKKQKPLYSLPVSEIKKQKINRAVCDLKKKLDEEPLENLSKDVFFEDEVDLTTKASSTASSTALSTSRGIGYGGGCCEYCYGGGCMACSGSGIMAGGRCPKGFRKKRPCLTKRGKMVRSGKGRCKKGSRRTKVCVSKKTGKISKRMGKGKGRGKAKKSPWLKHLAAFRKKHSKMIKREGLTVGDVAKMASETY